MSSLGELFIKKETLETILSVLNQKTGDDAKGVKIQISISDTSNDYGQNVSATVSQTKDQREAKVKPFYVANGKIFWTDGKIEIAKKKEATTATVQAAASTPTKGDLPF